MTEFKEKTWWMSHKNYVALKRTIGRCAHYTDINYHTTALSSMIKFFRKMEDVREHQIALDVLLKSLKEIEKEHKKLGSLPLELLFKRSEIKDEFNEYLGKYFDKEIRDMVDSAF